jgi:hypothetical protein
MRLQTLWTCAVALLPVATLAQVPAGGEFLVNANTNGLQSIARITARSDGGFVVVWNNYDFQTFNVLGRLYDASGVPQGSQFTGGLPFSGSAVGLGDVAADAKGAFVVTWAQPGASSNEIYGRLFDPSGAPRGPAFRVNAYTTGSQLLPVAAMDRRGNFVVVWQGFDQDGYGVIGRRFDAQGSPLGAEFIVPATTINAQERPAVGMDAGGNFVVVWQNREAGGLTTLRGRRFTAGGSPAGPEFKVSTQATVNEVSPAVASDPAGDFAVAWNRVDGSDLGVFARPFDRNGAPPGAEFQVNTFTTGAQVFPSVAVDGGGNFVIGWDSPQDGSFQGAYAARFDASGAARGGEFRVNTYTLDWQRAVDVAMDVNGNFVAVWTGRTQVGDGSDAAAQRFGGLRASALRVDTGANGVWEPGETVDVRPTWRNVNGGFLTFSGLLTSLAGPPGATYTIVDSAGAYGTVANNTAAECVDCYAVAVDDPAGRPALHWDASVSERITPDTLGQYQGWRLHIGRSFSDVSVNSPYYRYIETLLHHGIAGGCGGALYCPASATTRDQMAVFVLLAKEGAGYLPPACTVPMFNDVPASSAYCRYIEELARRGVVSGCGGGNYCPTASVSREQMPVFVLRTLDPALSPPACGVPRFADVPASSPYCRWIEELVRRGVVSGCGPSLYCPQSPVTREQMGVFVTGTFGLLLYGS